ncbi:MAG: segregation/condensation protein A [Pelagibacterales bacterium]|nr:segregation/condensation protein A [Pelagibacterales bacterium]
MNDSLSFNVNLNNFKGPLEVLLDLAKSQKVDLEKISITILVDQFLDFIKSNEKINLVIASEYLLMATWLTYLKSKLLLPETDEEEFKALEVAEKLKLQLKKLELIRLLSDQMLKRKRLGKDIFMRGIRGRIKSIHSTKYSLTMFEIFKCYSSIIMSREFQKMNIPKLPVFTTEEGIKRIKEFFGKLSDWKNIDELLPINISKSKNFKRTGKAGIFAGSLELVKEGDISIKQRSLFDNIFIKENK